MTRFHTENRSFLMQKQLFPMVLASFFEEYSWKHKFLMGNKPFKQSLMISEKIKMGVVFG